MRCCRQRHLMITQTAPNIKNQVKNGLKDRPLGNIAILSATDTISDGHKTRIKRYKLLSGAQKILIDNNVCNPRNGNPHRTRFCHARRTYLADNIVIKLNNNDISSEASIGNVQTCGSVWSCPVCAARIAVQKGKLVQKALQYAKENNQIPIMVALTASHDLHTPLKEFKKKFKAAWNMFSAHRQWKNFKKNYGLRHWIANREITYGANGWHYHMHLLLFMDAVSLKYADNDIKLEEALSKLWLNCLAHKGLSGLEEYALKVSAGENVGVTYLTKIGLTEDAKTGDLQYEMTASGNKKSGYTIWDILRHASYGDKTSETLYIEFVGAMFGDSFLSFSKGFLPLLHKLAQQSEDDGNSEKIDWIEIAPYWWGIVYRSYAIADLLECAAKTRDTVAVRWFLYDLQDELIDAGKLPDYHRVYRRVARSSEDNIICIRKVLACDTLP